MVIWWLTIVDMVAHHWWVSRFDINLHSHQCTLAPKIPPIERILKGVLVVVEDGTSNWCCCSLGTSDRQRGGV